MHTYDNSKAYNSTLALREKIAREASHQADLAGLTHGWTAERRQARDNSWNAYRKAADAVAADRKAIDRVETARLWTAAKEEAADKRASLQESEKQGAHEKAADEEARAWQAWEVARAARSESWNPTTEAAHATALDAYRRACA